VEEEKEEGAMLKFVFFGGGFFFLVSLMFDFLISCVDVQFIAQVSKSFLLSFWISLQGIFTTRLVFWDLCLKLSTFASHSHFVSPAF
jgi:hypothetical protein